MKRTWKQLDKEDEARKVLEKKLTAKGIKLSPELKEELLLKSLPPGFKLRSKIHAESASPQSDNTFQGAKCVVSTIRGLRL